MSTTSTDRAVKQPVWDLPTRLFHWLLVAAVAFSWWSAEQEELDLHIWSGLTVLTLVLFRLLWGLFGSSTARFANFVTAPGAVVAYLRDMKGWRSAGHSPLGAIGVLSLLTAVAVQVGLGLFATDDEGLHAGPLSHLVSLDLTEELTNLHQDFFDVLLIIIGLHVAAIAFYRLVLGKKLVGPMVTGKAVLDPQSEPMRPAKRWAALLCLIAAIAFTRWIMAGAPPLGG